MKVFSRYKKAWLALVVVLVALFAIIGFGNGGSKGQTVKIGITGSDDRIWKPIAKKLKKQNINLKIVEFNDYNTPNKALAQGEVDLNAFQNYQFLNDWNKANKGSLVSVGDTYIAPQRIYSKKVDQLSDLKSGAKIVIPNDATNEDRALRILEQAGLIKLNNDSLHTVKSIAENDKNLKVTPLDAAQTAHSLAEVDAAVVNNDVAQDAGLKVKQALYVEKITKASKPYVNIIAAEKSKKNDKIYKKIVKAYQSSANEKQLKKVYKGTTYPAWNYNFND